MKKAIFFFIFLLFASNVYGIALTPPKIEFIGNNEMEFIIFNTNDFESKFRVEADDGFRFSKKEFALGAKERISISVLPEDVKDGDGIIYVKEVVSNVDGLKLENGIGLKYHINDKEESNLDGITGAAIGLMEDRHSYLRVIGSILLVMAILAVVFYKNKKSCWVKDKLDGH